MLVMFCLVGIDTQIGMHLNVITLITTKYATYNFEHNLHALRNIPIHTSALE